MSGRLLDALTLGPARRRRALRRRLRRLDVSDRPPRPGRNSEAVRTIAVWLITVAALLALVTVWPGVVPTRVRQLVGIGPDRLSPPVAAQRESARSYRFLAHQRGAPRDPVAYDPCRPIEVELNPAGAPADAEQLVLQAMSRLHQATGLVFTYQGISERRPGWRGRLVPMGSPGGTPVLVSWADEDEVPQLAGSVAGLGGSTRVATDGGELRYVTGQVTLDKDAFADIAQRPNGQAQAQAIVYHEFGHLVGLDHVRDPRQLMYASNTGQLDFAAGDLAGLAKLGKGRCF